MSDTDTDDTRDPLILHLRERRLHLLREVDTINVRVDEIDQLLNVLEDGRRRVSRRRRTAAAPEQPDLPATGPDDAPGPALEAAAA